MLKPQFKYLEFYHTGNQDKIVPVSSKFWSLLDKFARKYLPQSNPDFEGLYLRISKWKLEYDLVNNYPSREIGYNSNGEILVIGPINDNLGFWTDTELQLGDFEKFSINEIEKTSFENEWDSGIIKFKSLFKMKE